MDGRPNHNKKVAFSNLSSIVRMGPDTKFKLQGVKPSSVLKLLTTVDTAKASGINNKLLKIAAPYIYQPLADLFNLSIETNTFPWELA